MTSFISKKTHITIRWAALLVALTATTASLLQAANIRPVFADDGGYPWVGATCIDGTDCSGTYNWGYSLPCPQVDPSCTTYEYPNSQNPTAGMGDPWGYGVRNCTSYAAWKVNQTENADIHGWGQAYQWATNAPSSEVHAASGYTPQIGDIAEWDATTSNPYGHVAYVFAANGSTASFDEYNSGYPKNGSSFQWGLFYSSFTSSNYPAGGPNHYIHVGTPSGTQPSTPSSIARDSADMAVFYNDGNSNLVNWSWNSSTGWASQSWSDSGGIHGQPAVVSRTTASMDVFYTTGQNKLVNKGWTSSGGWTGPTVLLSSGVAGDPAVTARDSSDLQVFYRDTSGDIKSVSWNSTSGWNTNPQNLYSSAATTDPTATSRSSDSMEVFFGKNNGNLVHLGWSSENSWITQDWGAGAGVTGKPTAITRNSGGDMSAYYQENDNGKVAEEHWNWQTGWGWQDWTASLAGSPSAVAGVTNTIDDFYRETGGNIVDRYFGSNGWQTTNVVGSGSATGNPNAIVRDTSNEEVFFWNGTNLEDGNWNTGRGSWSVSTIN